MRELPQKEEEDNERSRLFWSTNYFMVGTYSLSSYSKSRERIRLFGALIILWQVDFLLSSYSKSTSPYEFLKGQEYSRFFTFRHGEKSLKNVQISFS